MLESTVHPSKSRASTQKSPTKQKTIPASLQSGPATSESESMFLGCPQSSHGRTRPLCAGPTCIHVTGHASRWCCVSISLERPSWQAPRQPSQPPAPANGLLSGRGPAFTSCSPGTSPARHLAGVRVGLFRRLILDSTTCSIPGCGRWHGQEGPW